MKKRKIICLSGWGQNFDSLSKIFKNKMFENFQIIYHDYLKFCDFESFLLDFRKKFFSDDIECILGWSLGGQIACRLISSDVINPKKLILIASPFQFVKNKNISAGMPQGKFDEFLSNFKNSPDITLKKFAILTIINDPNSKKIIQNLDIRNDNFESLIFWLEELGKFSCFDLNFNNFPPTLYFHGDGDVIVNIRQKEYFKNKIKNFDEIIINKCGHAPHLNNLHILQGKIGKFVE